MSNGQVFHLRQVVELTFESEKDVSNPYLNLDMTATFASPSGKAFDAHGFWDGGRNFKVRFAPDELGTWTWTTRSGDPQLGGQTGALEVRAYEGANPWFSNGPLEVHESRRAFRHHDGHPFFWLADTAWSAPAQAKFDEWSEYLATRSRQGFNVVQINSLPQWDASGPALREPFQRISGKYDFVRPLPEYFQDLDRFVSMAQEAGLASAIVVLWFNYVPGDNIDWNVDRPGSFDMQTAGLYAQYLVSRYSAYSPIWIISGDSAYNTSVACEIYESAGSSIKAASPRPALVTAHLNGETPAPLRLNSCAWLDFHVYQSCHLRDSADRARRYSAAASALLPTRPILNSEPCYDALRQFDPENHQNVRFDRKWVRRTSWVSVLSGATAGLTYGAHGIWPWHRSGQSYGPMHYGLPLDWREALRLESSDDVATLSRFMSEIRWWEFGPRTGVRAEQRRSVLQAASDSKGDTLLVYVGDRSRLSIPASFGDRYVGAWLDPKTGLRSPAGLARDDGTVLVEACDWEGDAVLRLDRVHSD